MHPHLMGDSIGEGVVDGGGDGARRADPESYTWPLVSIALVILPQLLIPGRDRIGPPLLVPGIESVAFLVLLVIAAKPGPVPRSARSVVLGLFGVLVVANTIAAGRL